MAVTSFPDTGDNLDQANLQSLLRAVTFNGSWVIEGYEVTDASGNVRVAPGMALVYGKVVENDANIDTTPTASTTNYVWLETDGDVVLNTTGSAPTANALLLATVTMSGSSISTITGVGSVTTGRDRFEYKASDESVSSSTTLQDDDDLVVSLTVGLWLFDLWLRCDTDPAGIKFDIVCTSNNYAGHWFYQSANAAGSSQYNGSLAIGGTAPATANTGDPYLIRIAGWVWLAEEGTLKLQWAQNSSNASATTVDAGSCIHVRRVG